MDKSLMEFAVKMAEPLVIDLCNVLTAIGEDLKSSDKYKSAKACDQIMELHKNVSQYYLKHSTSLPKLAELVRDNPELIKKAQEGASE